MNDEKVEKYLSEFRPRAVRPLARPGQATMPWVKRLAVAAIVLVCAGSGWWYGRRGLLSSRAGTPRITEGVVDMARPETARPNAFALTRLALTDETRFEAQLASDSRAVLPNFGGASTLRVLSKE